MAVVLLVNLFRTDSISERLQRAIDMSSDSDRVLALRQLTSPLHSKPVTQPLAANSQPELPDILHEQRLARAAMEVHNHHSRIEINELVLIEFIKAKNCDAAICAFAEISDLPIPLSDRLFYIDALELLIVACRAQNFAWSTVRQLLEMRGTAEDVLHPEGPLCLAYHDITLRIAQRFVRFLRAHFLMTSDFHRRWLNSAKS